MLERRSKSKRLDLYEEVLGTLMELIGDDGFLCARISEVPILLPLEMENELRPLMGARIGILHTDVPGKEFLVRILSARKAGASVFNSATVSNSNIIPSEVI